MDEKGYIREKFKTLNIELSDKQADMFYRYYEMLIETNKVMNLTAITDFEDVVLKHFIDSAALLYIGPDYSLINEILLECRSNGSNSGKGGRYKVLDMGTGAGFPGIPLKILLPEIELTLVDSLNKRIGFLNDVVNELGLKGVKCIHARAEELGGKPGFREKYDLVVSRAVARLATLAEWCLPYVKLGGLFLPYKAGDAFEEIEEGIPSVETLGGELVELAEYDLPVSDLGRSIPIIEKINPTPGKYPRGGNKAVKDPIL